MTPATDPVAAGFRGAAVRLTAAGLASVAQTDGFEQAALDAVLDVESSGGGFDEAGRPKILTEPSQFYRLLGPGPKRDRAVALGIAYPTWGEKPYPVGSDANYARLAAMCGVCEMAALEATSWGIAQVMGFNSGICGYATVGDMVLAAMASEAAQFGFLLSYVNHVGLAHALRSHDWATFARGYNGSGAVQAYAAKLAAAYARHAGAAPALQPPALQPPALQAPASTMLARLKALVLPARPAASAPDAPDAADTLNDAEWLRVRAGGS